MYLSVKTLSLFKLFNKDIFQITIDFIILVWCASLSVSGVRPVFKELQKFLGSSQLNFFPLNYPLRGPPNNFSPVLNCADVIVSPTRFMSIADSSLF